jgi:cell division protein ZapA
MAQVSLQINGYGYILGCGDGEEAHLRALAEDLNNRIDQIKAATGPSGEARMLLMAALMLSDELHDLRANAAKAPPPAASAEAVEPKAAKRLRAAAKRAEAIAAEPPPAPAPPAESAQAAMALAAAPAPVNAETVAATGE